MDLKTITNALPIRNIILTGEGSRETGILPLVTSLYAGWSAGRFMAKKDLKKITDESQHSSIDRLRSFWIGSSKPAQNELTNNEF